MIACKFYSILQGGCAAIVVPGVDLIRIWVGPLPSYVCTLAIMAKNYYFISIIFVYTSLIVMKFVFVCVLKRIPQMDDDYIANVITQVIKLFCIIIVGSKFWYEKPNMQQVS